MAAPVNTVLPAITGTVEVGQPLTSSPGTWTGAASYSYKWYRGAAVITGATSASYTPTTADILIALKCRVTTFSSDSPPLSAYADTAATIPVPSTLVVEDGTCKTASDSYVTLAEADTYHASRGNTDWAATSVLLKEQAIRRATTYIDQNYYARWKGSPVAPLTQGLQWPRAGVKIANPQDYYDVYPSYYDVAYAGFLPITCIPKQLKYAVCEAAYRELTARLAPDQKRGGAVQSVTVGPITQVYSATAPAKTSYRIIDQLLAALLRSANLIDLERC